MNLPNVNFRFALTCVYFLWALNMYGQKADFINFVPVSPNAAALGKFGNIPVSYYTGVPSIEVPLYTTEQKGLNVPIKLSYHAGGIKVSELASWVGLGWALNAGGSVVRNERGLSDDNDMVGYLKNGKIIDEENLNIGDYYRAAKGWLDLESDEYLFNFPGGSGKFVLDKQANAILVPHQQVKVYPLDFNGEVFTPGTMGAIMGWKIVTTDGIQYFFEAIEKTRQIDQLANNLHTTAWNLTRVISADKAETITFEYQDAGFTANMPISQTEKVFVRNVYGNCSYSAPASSPYSILHSINSKRLHKINFSNGYIQFFPTAADRCELPGEKFLDKVVVFNKNDVQIKEIQFKYGYLIGASIVAPSQVSCPTDNARLILLSVQETGKNPYKFEYIHDKGLPTRFSAAQDHWGFYNREHSDQLSLIPDGLQISPTVRILGSGRETNFDFGKQGSLQKIIYPTGGNTQFEYEAHKAELSTLKNFTEFVEAYNIQTNPARIFEVDYGYNNHEIATFVINYLQTGVGVSFMTENFAEASRSYFKVVNSQNEDMGCSFSHREGAKRYYGCGGLPNGTYKIIAMSEQGGAGTPIGQTYPLTILEYNSVTGNSPSSLITIGGLRIRKITDTDPVTGNTQAREFEYYLGALTWGIKYSSLRKEYLCTVLNGNSLSSYGIGEFYILSSNSNYPLSNTQGSPVGYSEVIMREYYLKPDNSKAENGYTKFEYTTPFEYADYGFPSYYIQGHSLADPPLSTEAQLYSDNTSSLINYQFPYATPRSNDWKRGLLKQKIVRKKNADGSYFTVSAEKNLYKVSSVNREINSVHCGNIFDANVQMNENSEMRPTNAPMDEVAFAYYNINGEYIYLQSAESHSYDDSGNDFFARTEYFYDNPDHLLPSRTLSTTSDGRKKYSITTYPQDYASGTPFIDALIAENNISARIENVIYQEDADGTEKVTEGVLCTYLSDGKGLKEYIKVIENPGKLLIDNFKFSNRPPGIIPSPATAKTVFSPDSKYAPRVVFNKYSNGNVLEQQKVSDVVHSYLWDHNYQYLIAHVVNATNSNIAYSGFEADDSGNWTFNGGIVNNSYALTGIKSYSLSTGNSILKSGLTTGNYVVSYWSRNGSQLVNGATSIGSIEKSGWTLYEHKLNNINSVTIEGNAMIDELRLYPANAQMTTYTYAPLIGLIAISDVNNKITYYDYDSAGRLIIVRDENEDIVKKYKYNYTR